MVGPTEDCVPTLMLMAESWSSFIREMALSLPPPPLLVTFPVTLIVTSPPRLCLTRTPAQPPVAVATEMKRFPSAPATPDSMLIASPPPPPALLLIAPVNERLTLPAPRRSTKTAWALPAPVR